MDLGKDERKTPLENLCPISAVTKSKIGLTEKMLKKQHCAVQNGLASPRKPPGHTQCFQIKVPPEPISNTVIIEL